MHFRYSFQKGVPTIHLQIHVTQGEEEVKPTRKLWQWLGVVFVLSFAALGYLGREIYLAAPPIPSAVVSSNGTTLFTAAQVEDGQRAWRSVGGQQLGSVWGHGSYVAPDWSADWLHREIVFILDKWAITEGAQSYATLSQERQSALRGRLTALIRTNTYNPQTGILTVDPIIAD